MLLLLLASCKKIKQSTTMSGGVIDYGTGEPIENVQIYVQDDFRGSGPILNNDDIGDMMPPGEVYSYQNAAFAFSGEVISSVIGKDIKRILQDEMFDQLGMCETSLDFESIKESENVTLPHSKTKNGWRKRNLNKMYYNAIPSRGINTNTTDVSKLLLALLGNSLQQCQQNIIRSGQVS